MSPTKKKPAKRQAARGKTAGRASVKRRRKSAVRVPALRRQAAVAMFYAKALAIEIEASERYRALAQEMRSNDNLRTAELFLKLAQFEAGHADKLREVAAAAKLSTRARSRLSSQQAAGTEVPNYEFLYRRVPPQHALLMALAAEQRAKSYFEGIRASTDDPAIRKLAAQFAREETLHIAWIEEALLIEPQPVNPLIDFLEPPKAAD